MSLLVVVNLLWLTSVTLTDAWPCSCDNNGCNIYNMAVLMYRSMDKTTPTGNLLISPVNLWIVLVYAQNMATGDTKTSISRVTYEKRPGHCKEYTSFIFSDECKYNELFLEEIAPFWLRQCTIHSGKLKPKYEAAKNITIGVKYYYTSKTRRLSFKKRDIVNHIRRYEENIYHHKKNFMLTSDITKSAVFILLSLIKFQDKWRYPFFITDEKKYGGKLYELMHTSGLFFYAYDANHGNRYIFLDCQHRSLSMVLVLPDSNNSKVETSWDMFYPKDKQVSHLNLSIPKFTFEVEYSLKQVIYDINCEILFSKKCELSGLNGMKAPVSQIVQRTFVRVDEEGVMFEAHTILVSDPSGSPRDQPYVGSSANQPFMFYLFYDKKSPSQPDVHKEAEAIHPRIYLKTDNTRAITTADDPLHFYTQL